MNKKNSYLRSGGFTLIELLVYIGLVSMVVSAAVIFAWNAIYGRVKSQVQIELNQNMKLIIGRINTELRLATDINSISANSISLEKAGSTADPTVISLNNGTIEIGLGVSGDCPVTNPCALSSNKVTVNQLNFTQLTTPLTKAVKYELSASHNNPANLNEYQAESFYQSSVTLRSYQP